MTDAGSCSRDWLQEDQLTRLIGWGCSIQCITNSFTVGNTPFVISPTYGPVHLHKQSQHGAIQPCCAHLPSKLSINSEDYTTLISIISMRGWEEVEGHKGLDYRESCTHFLQSIWFDSTEHVPQVDFLTYRNWFFMSWFRRTTGNVQTRWKFIRNSNYVYVQ